MSMLTLLILGLLLNFVSMRATNGINQNPNDNDSYSDRAPSFMKKTNKFLKKFIPKVSYRLVKKHWVVPDHPDEETVYDEYPGTWEKAFKTMTKLKYPFEERKIKSCEELFTLRNNKGEVEYDRNLESIIVLHGLHGTADVPFVQAVLAALRLRNLHKRYNLFAINMPDINKDLGFAIFRELTRSDPRYERMAELLSILLVKGIKQGYWKAKDIHLVGMSVSGNLVGYMGRHVYMVYNEKIGSVLSLDPVSNERNSNFIHLSHDDAIMVHIYHTCSWVSGTRERIGTADFVFNGAYKQPECKDKRKFPSFTYSPYRCSHRKVTTRFWYVILFPNRFKARKCGTWHRFKNCFCESNEEATITYPIGNNPARGVYQIITGPSKPYGLGDKGSHCDAEKKKWFDTRREAYFSRAISLSDYFR